MRPEQQVREWFEKHGVVFAVPHDPRGKYWVRGYLNEVVDMIVDQTDKAEKRGYQRGLAKKKKAGA